MLNVRGLTVLHQPDTQLVDISFKVGRGEVAVVIGPNNSGKSLLLQTIANPESRYDGDISINHYKARAEPEKAKRQLGYLAQELALPLYLTGFEYLELIGTFYDLIGEARTERIIKLAQTLGCHRQLYTVMERINSTTRQKIAFIGSLCAEPLTLVLDEPLNQLDYQAQQSVKQLLQQSQQRGASLLVATNDLTLAQAIGDYFIILSQGRVIAEGSLQQLSHQARTGKDLTAVYQYFI